MMNILQLQKNDYIFPFYFFPVKADKLAICINAGYIIIFFKYLNEYKSIIQRSIITMLRSLNEE